MPIFMRKEFVAIRLWKSLNWGTFNLVTVRVVHLNGDNYM